jgi:hypothetical protein
VAEKEVGDDGTGGEEGVVDGSLIRRGQKVLSGAKPLPLLPGPNPMVMRVSPSLKRPSRGPKTRPGSLRKVILNRMARKLSGYQLFVVIEVPLVV